MIRQWLRTRLAYRSAASILTLVGLLGILFVLVALKLVSDQEQRRQAEQLAGLLDTVDNTLRIAAFLADEQLAGEVADGLINNPAVSVVTIRSDDRVLVKSGEREPPSSGPLRWLLPPSPALERSLSSPFDSRSQVGTVSLVPDQDVIASRVVSASVFAMALMALQMVVLAVAIIIVVIHHITRPITRISRKLHTLAAEAGEKLTLPRGSEHDEIGRLVRDVNAIIDYLMLILDQERDLRMQRELEERKFRAIFDNAESAIFLIDEQGRVASWNPAFERHLAVTEAILRDNATLDLDTLVADEEGELREAIRRCRSGSATVHLEAAAARRPGHWLQLTLTPVDDRIQGIANDISERMLAEQEALRRSLTDPLTGLGNRAGAENRLSRLMERPPAHQDFALLLLDLDHFKEVNDTLGHQAGDELLRIIARRLTDCTRKSDYLARPGGDEFTVILEGILDRADALKLAESLLPELSHPIELEGGKTVTVGVSIGVAFPRPGDEVASLTKRADAAMYNAKHQGRNQYQVERDA